MLIASAKRKENIAEYLLYMWQIEDIIRAFGLDIERIQHNIIDQVPDVDDDTRRAIREWYESLIDMMRREGVEKKGHLQINQNVIIALDDLHRRLLADPKAAEYSADFYRALPYIVELRAKAGEDKKGEVETCLEALYGVLLLRMKGTEISAETQQAIKEITRYLARLSHYYKLDYNNELDTL